MADVKNPHVVYRDLVRSTKFVSNTGNKAAAGKFAGVLQNTENKKAASLDSAAEKTKKEKEREEKMNKAKDQALKTQAVASANVQQLKPIETPNKDD